MTIRVITLGDGRQVRLGTYVNAWTTCKKIAPHAWLPCTPGGWPGTAEDALQEFRAGLHDRINRRLPWYDKGRKWDSDWQRETLQAAIRLNTPRLAIHWLPPHLKARFAHRLSDPWDR